MYVAVFDSLLFLRQVKTVGAPGKHEIPLTNDDVLRLAKLNFYDHGRPLYVYDAELIVRESTLAERMRWISQGFEYMTNMSGFLNPRYYSKLF